MKKIVFLLLSVSCFLHAESEDVIEIAAPTSYIDYDRLDQAVDAWRDEVVSSLNEQEMQLVAHFIRLGNLFSLIDLRTRQVVRSLLPLVWQLQEEITSGRRGISLFNEIEERGEKLRKLVVYHDMMLKEWTEWTNALDVSGNKKVQDAIEAINEHVRFAIEQCLGSGDWQQIAAVLPPVLDQNIKAGTLLRALCPEESAEDAERTDSEQREQETVDAACDHEQPVVYFAWLTNAANLFNERSWESIESVSQLLIYQEELLAISGAIYHKYLQALNVQESEQEVLVIA